MNFKRHWLLILIVLFVAALRLHLRDMPLERDEGEYAYAGQMILKGEPPYKSAYNMKLPGTYAAYAMIMAVFGQTPSGIRIGVMLVNAASIVLVYLIGRRLLDHITGIVAAASFALLSLSPSVFGLSGHATHFVLLPALGGTLLLLRRGGYAGPSGREKGRERTKERTTGQSDSRTIGQKPEGDRTAGQKAEGWSVTVLFCAGLCMGLGFLMKQHGVFFGLFGAAWLFADRYLAHREQVQAFRRKVLNPRPDERGPVFPLVAFLRDLLVYGGGFVLPYALTCALLWMAGVFPQFWFWTVEYAREYAAAIPLVQGPEMLKLAMRTIVGPNFVLWLLAAAGLGIMWSDHRLSVPSRVFVVALSVCAAGSVAVGLYFRGHYFIPLLPVLGLLAGLAVSRSFWLLRNDRSIELFMAIPILIGLTIGIPLAIIGNGSTWFSSPEAAGKENYRTTMFIETAKVGEYIRQNAQPGDKVAVIGSEPQIYFLSRHRAATGFIYMYPLMEKQPFAARMQKDMIDEIEKAKPEWVVYVEDHWSWLRSEDSHPLLLDWWKGYWESGLDLVEIRKVTTQPMGTGEMEALNEKVSNRQTTPGGNMTVESQVMVFRRKS